MNTVLIAVVYLGTYLLIGLIVQRVLLKFTKIHHSDITAMSILWIVLIPVVIFFKLFIKTYSYLVLGIDKYLDRFGGNK